MNKKYFIMLLTLALTILALTACGSNKDETNATTKESASKEAANNWPRTIENSDGTVAELVKKPEKIAVVHFGYAEYLLALDNAPIATTNKEVALSFETLKPYEDALNKMEDLGETMAPNIERLAEMKPDLIIAGAFQKDMLDNLRKIAPVIVDKRDVDVDMGWQDTITYYGEILGEEDKAQQYIEETEQVIKETHDKLTAYQDETFIFVRPDGKGNFGVVGSDSFEHYHEKGFGLHTPEGYPEQWEDMSLEGLFKLNPDYIFFQDNLQTVEAAMKQVENDDVWKNLTAVKNDHVYYLDISLNTGSPLAIKLAAKSIIESLEQK